MSIESGEIAQKAEELFMILGKLDRTHTDRWTIDQETAVIGALIKLEMMMAIFNELLEVT